EILGYYCTLSGCQPLMAENRGRRAKYALCPRLLYVTPSASPDMSLRIYLKLWLRLLPHCVSVLNFCE
ncbi:MAG TPA: hypothetical protein VGL91_12625, partial [Acidobacteriota bacterium]